MNDNNEIQEKINSERLDRSDYMAFLAVLLSVAAFGVSIYQTTILRSQQVIMQEEKKAAVWPFLELSAYYFYGSEESNVRFVIKNKGVGPARIKNAKVIINDREIISYDTVIEVIKELFPQGFRSDLSYIEIDGVFSANEEQLLLSFKTPRFPNDQELFSNLKLGLSICYCSIYGDCWTLTEKAGEPLSGCIDD